MAIKLCGSQVHQTDLAVSSNENNDRVMVWRTRVERKGGGVLQLQPRALAKEIVPQTCVTLGHQSSMVSLYTTKNVPTTMRYW